MSVFYVLLFVPIALQHFVIGKQSTDYEKKNRYALFVFFLLWFALIAFRHKNIGNDTLNYFNAFLRYSSMSWNNLLSITKEVGFAYFNKIISLISKEPQVFLAITAFMTIAMIYPTYRRLHSDASLTIVLFCMMSTFVMAFSGIRQMLAIGIGFIAYEFTHRKKLVPFILIVILAMTIHMSAFMLAFMYPVYHAKITKKWLYVVIPVIALVFAFNRQIFSSVAVVLETFTEYDASITETGAYAMLILFAVFSVFSFVIPDESKLDKETIGLRNLLLLALILQMFAPLHTIAMRMNYYYIIFIPLLLPKIIEARSNRMAQVAVFARHIMVVFFLVYFFYNAYTGENNLNVFPYKFFWEAA